MSKVDDMAATKREPQAEGMKLIKEMVQYGSVGLAVYHDVKSNGRQSYERVR